MEKSEGQQQRQYLWVNKNEASSSLTKGDPSESKAIFQFVQHQRSDVPHRTQDGRYGRRSLASRPPDVPSARSMQGRLRLSQLRSPPRTLPSSTSVTSSSAQDDEQSQHSRTKVVSHRSPSPVSVQEWIARFRRSWASVPSSNFMPGSSVDPFSVTPLPLTGNVEVLLRYHSLMTATGSHVDKVEVLPPHLQPVQKYNKVGQTMLQGCMQNKLKFSSLLMIMAARMVHLSRIPLMGSAQPEYYMQMTLRSVREKMLDCQEKGIHADAHLVQSIHGLALAAWICQLFEEASTHVRAAKSLLTLLDMDDPYHAFTAQGLVNIDKMICIETGWVPEFPVLFDPGPMNPTRLALIKEEIADFAAARRQPPLYPHSPVPQAIKPSRALISHQVDILTDASTIFDFRLGRGFEDALQAGLMSPALATIVRDILDCVAVGKYVWRTSNATREDAEWMCKRMRAICHRLLLLPADLHFAGTSIQASKDEALRLALLLIVLRCTNRMAFRSAQPNMRRLQHALFGIDKNWASHPRLSPSRSELPVGERPKEGLSAPSTSTAPSTDHENSLLLWTLMTGLFNAQDEPEEAWFMLRAAFVARHRLGILDYESLENFMTDFLFSKTQQRKSLLAVSLYLSM
ncbi:hypothetical protein LTR84_007074 [Exophiala bonariae]|uniref:Transcription factor domain-containing protein n=1 Tax=Exophiala bonariae TaxID=1690606 RepID=A0AAV9MZT6_9EURO|nr:hypothetical protein LTR84_007074 [Exophiala bonariae]